MDKTAAAALFAWLDRELWLVTAKAETRQGGLIATFVSQASLPPELPRVIVGIAKQHYTWKLIEASNAFALHLLGEHNLEWIGHFGLQSGRDRDKLEHWPVRGIQTGSPVLDGAIGWMDCLVESRLDTGDRTLYLAQVVQSQVTHYGPPLTLQKLLDRAPPDMLSHLKQLMHRDSAIDAAAILTWRKQNGIPIFGEGA